jgi:hypothetical protein
VYVKIDIGKYRRTQQKLFITYYAIGGMNCTCTVHFSNSGSLPDDDPIVGSKLVALCNK